MNRVCLGVFAAMTMGMTAAMDAAPLGSVRMPVAAMLGRAGQAKTVHFGLQNSMAVPLKLMCGEQAMTVDAGKLIQLKLPVGMKVTLVEAAGTHAAGEVLAEVSSTLDGATLNVR